MKKIVLALILFCSVHQLKAQQLFKAGPNPFNKLPDNKPQNFFKPAPGSSLKKRPDTPSPEKPDNLKLPDIKWGSTIVYSRMPVARPFSTERMPVARADEKGKQYTMPVKKVILIDPNNQDTKPTP